MPTGCSGGVDPTLDHQLKEKLAEGREEGSFLYTGSMDTYRRDNYLTTIFNKRGIAQATAEESVNLALQVKQVLADRLAAYEMPQHSAAQRKLLQPCLPSACRY